MSRMLKALLLTRLRDKTGITQMEELQHVSQEPLLTLETLSYSPEHTHTDTKKRLNISYITYELV